MESNDTIRYLLINYMYSLYPEKSIPFIKYLLVNDFNYHFSILNFSQAKNYNTNELLNTLITKKIDREQMVKDLIKTNLLKFALSWKDHKTHFRIFYDIHLKCFLLQERTTGYMAYFCANACDPFYYLARDASHNSLRKIITFTKPWRIFMNFYLSFSRLSNKDIELVQFKSNSRDLLPSFTIYSTKCQFRIYF
ncbi:MAG: hypothetical protein EU539_10260 [Promethearchaeota archaeon]|nr:MAG: hypothetical protein EU539_10260 [Candidatus Lokiarchaeota archaeon]